ncbi:(d)CMP kinase [Allonocardiopsis opalescens]|uniref:Cytidylate kinase n=1 Tax=Allonocardiopsis opalescens TaxID=1144618 RepID=A0A2T0Q4C3_9ACTN|nr:(d)CMP kinase [Allonocardiopsis opalescens]PRX98656.1 cytidylate kinase [Allonocardiopsis opalescens]
MNAGPADSALVIAVDGPSGSGKSSTARGVARALGLRYLDTGAMYRGMTWWMIQHRVPVDDPAAVAARAGEPDIAMGTDPDAPAIRVDGTDVAQPIRTREVTNAVSLVSAVPEVRARLVDLQRRIIGEARRDGAGIVMEGRDIGSVVAPEATLKVYLTASENARAERRTKELDADPATTVALTRTELARRDRIDSTRATSPLAKADDAVEIDSTVLSLQEVVDEVLRLADKAVRR